MGLEGGQWRTWFPAIPAGMYRFKDMLELYEGEVRWGRKLKHEERYNLARIVNHLHHSKRSRRKRTGT